MNLTDFIKSFKNKDSPYGDFAKDFITSKSKAKTYKGIKRYLLKCDACQSALEVFEDIYFDYLKITENK